MVLLSFVDEKRLLFVFEKVYFDFIDVEREYKKKKFRLVIWGNSKLNIVLLINLIV